MAVDESAVRVSMRACLYAGDQLFELGPISAFTPQGLCDELADRLELLADTLRGPAASPADPCEGCGAPMVHRRGHPGRYTVVSREPGGDVAIYGIHNVGSCVMEREQAGRTPVNVSPDVVARAVDDTVRGRTP